MNPAAILGLVTVLAIVLFATFLIVVKRYKRCPSNKILVIYGKGTGANSSKVVHGGAAFVWPLIQDFQYMSLAPFTVDIPLKGALTNNNIPVSVPSVFTLAIDKSPEGMHTAAERLLGMSEDEIVSQAKEIVYGQMRGAIALMSIEEINGNRDKFAEQVNKNVNNELKNIGLSIINVNLTGISDEAGYIIALGKKAAAEAINKAKVEVAEQEKTGAIGETTALRERDISVAEQESLAASGVAEQERAKAVAIAQQNSQKVQGEKEAEMKQRVRTMELESQSVAAENTSKASIVDSTAELQVRAAEATKKSEIAQANAQTASYEAKARAETARLEAEEVVRQNIEKQKAEIKAEAQAEVSRRIAKGEADATLLKWTAEAEGLKKMMTAKAEGIERQVKSLGGNPALLPQIMLIEQMPALVAAQADAIKNLKIDKITVFDGQQGGAVKGLVQNFAGLLPAMHQFAEGAGITLPSFMGATASEAPEGKLS